MLLNFPSDSLLSSITVTSDKPAKDPRSSTIPVTATTHFDTAVAVLSGKVSLEIPISN